MTITPEETPMPSPLTGQQLDDIQARANDYAEGHTHLKVLCGPACAMATAVPALVAEVRRLRARVAELEGPAVEARAALAALCYDLEDPGTAALGALHLISRATVGVEAPKDDAALALARHDAQVMRRCAEFVRDTYDGDWADDAAATLERDANITERGCPGFEKEYQGVSDAKRRLANCKHCGKPWAKHPVAAAPVSA